MNVFSDESVYESIESNHLGSITSIVYSPTGDYFVTSSRDCTVNIWNGSNYSLLHTLSDHTDSVHQVCFSDDGEFLCTCSQDKKIFIYTVGDWEIYQQIENDFRVYCICFSKDLDFLLSGDGNYTLKKWNIDTGECELSKRIHQGGITNILIVDDSIITSSRDTTIKVLDMDWNICNELTKHEKLIESICVNSEGTHLLSCSTDGTCHLWELQTGILLASFFHNAIVSQVLFVNAPCPMILSLCIDGFIRVWNLNGNLVQTINICCERTRFTKFVIHPEFSKLICGRCDPYGKLVKRKGKLRIYPLLSR
eukprot:TRINITY_DN3303_c0_g7_i1.p1 TRINITY_DN3303_c0_g7~~TRINITY_DN3303_c0_g7_i1.p1  ORF type:complete len:309 (-),score=61.28 TRINITY_DN3303_c0_g7_i1:328-1254(-)